MKPKLTLEEKCAAMHARAELKRVEARRRSARNAMRKRRRTLERRNVKHVQEWRAKKKAEKKAEHHAVLMAEKAERDARRVARQEKNALDLRKHGTAQAGFVAGWQAVVPQTDEELKALSWSKRYREAYTRGAVEKRSNQELMEASRRSAPEPINIKL
jgi:hypothetical protein